MNKVLWVGLLLVVFVMTLAARGEPVAAEKVVRVPPFEQIAGPEILPNYLANSSFEVDCCWEFPVTALTAKYSPKRAVNGVRSVRTGALKAKQNRFSYSSVRQSVRIPGSASSAVLVFSLWQRTTESAQQAIPKASEFDKTEAAMSGDVQYVLILNPAGQRLATAYWDRKNTKAWNVYTFNLMPFKGETITIHIGTYNDGVDGFTSMFVDDVSAYIFTHPSPPSTGLVVNGTFEEDAAWEFPLTPLPASYATANAYSGYRSARTGALDANANRYSYSSVRQAIALPENATQITFYFTLWQWTTESPLTPVPKHSDMQRGERVMAGDVQYALILDANNQIVAAPYWNRENIQTWNSFTVDVTQFKGQTIKIQFGTYNDGVGGYSGMYVDDVVMFATTP